MATVVTKMRFLEYGQPAPNSSRFKGIINGDTVFGNKGWMNYTARKDAINPNGGELPDDNEDSFLGYSGRAAAEHGYTMSSYGFLDTDEKRSLFREACHSAFNSEGDLIWDVVISLKTYEEAAKYGLRNQENYGAFINTALMDFFQRVDIDPRNIIWWEDYHSNTEHPHMHVCFLEKEHTRDRGKFSAKELRQLKYCIAKELTSREMQQQMINDTFADPFWKKDRERAEVIGILKKVDLDSIDGIDDLIRVLPRTGRLQYGAYQVAPFRSAIDKITDSLLESDALKNTYQAYLKYLETLEKNVDEKAGSHVATIKETELKQLHTDIGNIILKYIKEMRLSNKDTKSGYKFLNSELVKSDDEAKVVMKNDQSSDWKQYRSLRDQYYHLARSTEPSGKERREKMCEILGSMERFCVSSTNDQVRGLLAQRIALIYLYGKNVEKNLPLAEQYSRMAVECGADKACVILAKTCFAQDKHSEGMDALREGVSRGDSGSIYAYGLQLLSGKHCTKNREEGLVAVMNAAELGCVPAANYIMTHDQAQFKEAATKAAVGKVRSTPHRMSGGRNVGGEVASFVFNSDRIHVYAGQIEREIDAYLNDKNRIAQKSM